MAGSFMNSMVAHTEKAGPEKANEPDQIMGS